MGSATERQWPRVGLWCWAGLGGLPSTTVLVPGLISHQRRVQRDHTTSKTTDALV